MAKKLNFFGIAVLIVVAYVLITTFFPDVLGGIPFPGGDGGGDGDGTGRTPNQMVCDVTITLENKLTGITVTDVKCQRRYSALGCFFSQTGLLGEAGTIEVTANGVLVGATDYKLTTLFEETGTFRVTSCSSATNYRLEVLDDNGNLIEARTVSWA